MSLLVLGDIILDKYSFGRVSRLNPESPAPLLAISREEYRLGGAANVAANIASLGYECHLIGSVGQDANGDIIRMLSADRAIQFLPIRTEYPTITKQRFIEETYHQQMLRVDYEDRDDLADRLVEEVISHVRSLRPTRIILSDYEKWFLSPRLITEIFALRESLGFQIIVDVKPWKVDLYRWADIMKPNWKEFARIMDFQWTPTDEELDVLVANFCERFSTQLVLTRGDRGALVASADGSIVRIPTVARTVFDVSGAGDTFVSIMTLALSLGYSLIDAVQKANEASGIVVGKLGTAVVEAGEIEL